MNIDLDKRFFNPNFYHAMEYINDKTLRYLFFFWRKFKFKDILISASNSNSNITR